MDLERLPLAVEVAELRLIALPITTAGAYFTDFGPIQPTCELNPSCCRKSGSASLISRKSDECNYKQSEC